MGLGSEAERAGSGLDGTGVALEGGGNQLCLITLPRSPTARDDQDETTLNPPTACEPRATLAGAPWPAGDLAVITRRARFSSAISIGLPEVK